MKNTLAVVQSMVHQTWRNSPSPEDFIERLSGRIAALAGSHNLLVETQWQGADLRSLVENQMAPYLTEERARLHIAGGPVTLQPDLAMPFGMILHELTTNAAKYGALSNDKGNVNLSWEIFESKGKPMLKLIWEEQNGPTVKQAKKSGFGAKLIKTVSPVPLLCKNFCRPVFVA